MLRLIVMFCTTTVLASIAVAEEPPRRLLLMFDAPEAVQAVAVDDKAFYAIANSAIGKYDKQSGEKLESWQASDEAPVKHLNSGVVVDGKLYCAHSNFPKHPNTSSVEIFDAETLEHVGNHSFGIYEGSLTVVDWHDNAWWCVFAHYSKKVNNDPRSLPHIYTSLVKFDRQWRRLAGWVFPQQVLDRFAPHSCSGGGWGDDGMLYCTGHDRGEIYQLQLPAAGSELRLLKTFKLPITGQGISLDHQESGVVYGIDRPNRQVMKCRLGG
ncbi:hypothetical protein NG895_25695 [Aeoliella sp. ICT_H6.2]|uniref:Uncharacterized protein n=1 Tax=Aeoliella straminimaris TaxID=2954799 RepID=A0A9X2JKT0_9BACT|nr:hypothetical protein [Aeoliella straminimaris]MCO6047309.1 hypothetical protein [Aeoliella straminimaris]